MAERKYRDAMCQYIRKYTPKVEESMTFPDGVDITHKGERVKTIHNCTTMLGVELENNKELFDIKMLSTSTLSAIIRFMENIK